MNSQSVMLNSADRNAYRLMILKMKAMMLVGLLQGKGDNSEVICVNKLVEFVHDKEEMEYVVKVMFRVRSLSGLESKDVSQICVERLSEG